MKKYLGVLFTSEGMARHEINTQIGAVSAVMRTLCQIGAVRRG